jgi:hypothetical protein
MPRIITCPDCGQRRPHYACGLCQACYYKEWYRKPHARKNRMLKKCLRCDREFLSEGNHNRICPACREINAKYDWIEEHATGGT